MQKKIRLGSNFSKNLLILLLLIVAMPLTVVSLQFRTKVASHAYQACYFTHWEEILPQGSQHGPANMYVHLFRLRDDHGNYCNEFKTYADVVINPYQPARRIQVYLYQQNVEQILTDTVRATPATGSKGIWIRGITPPIAILHGCAGATADYFDENTGLTEVAHTQIACD